MYKQTREEMEKARIKREAALQAKKEAKEEAESTCNEIQNRPPS